jgi:LacI family transcriptional regulator
MPHPTLRSLARELNLSRTTISEALRGSPRVRAETAQRIRAVAAAAGYHHNPLAGAVMSELRRSRGELFRGVLAIVNIDEPDRPAYAASFHRELIRGATDRAGELGFKVETFVVGGHGVPVQRFDTILQSRGIQGLIILPTWGEPDLSRLDWSRYAGAYTDYIIERPPLHSVCSDHYRSMIAALRRLTALGYRRPGLFVQRHHDERLLHRWEGAFLAYQYAHPELPPVPPLVNDDITREVFIAWFRRHKPDVVLGHRSEVMAWMRTCGARIPKTHGFFCLNLLSAHTPCAGLDQQPWLLGARSAELVIAQLHRNEHGIPEHFSLTTIPARWVDGPTIRSAPPK